MTPLSDSDSDLGTVIPNFVPCFSPPRCLQVSECAQIEEGSRASSKHRGARACLRGWGQMFAEERPPPKKIFTPDGKYEFVEDGALGTGACGVVRIAKHLETGELYAIKIMSVTGRTPLGGPRR